MSRFTFRLPDLGEGTVAAEIVAWLVGPGDAVNEGQPIAEMSTDKAVVELPSPVTGRVLARTGGPGDSIAVGAELITFEVGEGAAAAATTAAAPAPTPRSGPASAPAPRSAPASAHVPAATRIMASPATRRRAREAGIDLGAVTGSGPGGRIQMRDLERTGDALATPSAAPAAPAAAATAAVPTATTTATVEIRVIGVRRVIAQRMSEAKRSIPHFSYVEECDVTELEALRQHLNAKAAGGATLSLLPLIVLALTRVLPRFPQCNAHYDAAREVIVRHRAVHVGIATQTPDGLKVPVVRNAERLGLAPLAAEIRRVAEAARTNKASREMLGGSTITVTSLGKLGGIASTPVINAPELAIIGVNRMVERAVVREGAVVIRQMMNLSSSFDHRFVDGFDAAAMIQALRERLEHPATLFMPDAEWPRR